MTLRKARYVVGESNFSLRVVAPLCPGAHKRVIEHPVRREFLDSEPSDGGDSNLLFVGSILETKGIFDAIRAFAAAVPAPWQMHVVGSGPDQNQRRMFDLVQQIKIGSRFHHWPELEIGGLISLMKRSSVFLLPTRIDTGPTALKESLSMGLWPICYDNSGPAEYIRKHRFGSLAVDGDFDSLCGELSKCISARPWNANGDRNAVIQRARTTFSREAAWNDLIDLYAVIAAGGVGHQLNSGANRTAPELSEL